MMVMVELILLDGLIEVETRVVSFHFQSVFDFH